MKIVPWLLLSWFFAAQIASAISPVEKEIEAVGIRDSDPPETKIALLLHLLNDSGYLFESSPDPQHGSATFTATAKPEALRLMEKYGRYSSGAPNAPYDLDSARTTTQMLEQRIGGECGTHARVFAELAHHLGFADSDLRIVSAVCDEDYREICPGGRGSVQNLKYQGGASGHVFVLLKNKKTWEMIKTTFSPFDEKSGPHFKEAQEARETLHRRLASKIAQQEAQNRARELIRNLTLPDLEIADFMSPDELTRQLAQGKTVPAPMFASLAQICPLTIFEVVRPDQYALHTFKDRPRIIATGRKDGQTCRFGPSQVKTN